MGGDVVLLLEPLSPTQYPMTNAVYPALTATKRQVVSGELEDVLLDFEVEPTTVKETWQANRHFLRYDHLPTNAGCCPFPRQGGQVQLFSLRAQCILFKVESHIRLLRDSCQQ